ncbi:Trp biosynthesis-associated membrane protein [Luedemannella helvata]|uniref:Tryptophan-associated transmembrane protein n=1 Tax=Luedemannella helvata TaxID=349315 RepID=A0ABN2KL00_9ACTN
MSERHQAGTARPPRAATTAARRALAVAVVASAGAAGLALLAATRTWAVEVTERAAPLPPASAVRTGAALAPVIPAFALVALAGAGALLATRALGRSVVAALMVASGGAVVAGAALTMADADAGRRLWPVLCLAAGAVIVAVGAVALRQGGQWPSMGTRYERAPAPVPDGSRAVRSTQEGRSDPARTPGRRSTGQFWDAIDRGDDPTTD